MSDLSKEIEIRSYNPSLDEDYVYSTWLQTYKFSSYFAKRILPPIFFKEHRKVLDYLINKPGMQLRVASPKGAQDIIVGYMAHELKEDRPVVHWIYVKKIYRNMGVAKELFKAAELNPNKITFTHWTHCQTGENNSYSVNEMIEKYPGMTYNPYDL